MSLIPQSARDVVGRAADPIARALIRGPVTLSVIAIVGLVCATGAAAAFASGRTRLGGLLVSGGGLLEVLSERAMQMGQRSGGGRHAAFAGFLSATLARLGEAVALGGVALFFARGGAPQSREAIAVLAAVAALATALLVAYTAARLEALGVDGGGSVAGRVERVVLLGVPLMLLGAGNSGRVMLWVVVVLTLLNAMTVVQHLTWAARRPARDWRGVRRHDTLPGHASAGRRGPAV